MTVLRTLVTPEYPAPISQLLDEDTPAEHVLRPLLETEPSVSFLVLYPVLRTFAATPGSRVSRGWGGQYPAETVPPGWREMELSAGENVSQPAMLIRDARSKPASTRTRKI